MRYGALGHFQTGVAIPVSGLKSAQSVGIGEYPDLELMGQWLHTCGMDIVQILPVNDTGLCSSPYSALSAFALNPAYLRLQHIDGSQPFADEIEQMRQRHAHGPVAYQTISTWKRELLSKIWDSLKSSRSLVAKVDAWIEAQPWVKTYALYLRFKAANGHKAWWEWSEEHRTASPEKLDKWWKKLRPELRIEAWIQMQCEQQLRKAAETLDSLQVKLKGDIPILINEDSADAWGDPSLFDMRNRAGAPPDMFCHSGQNWGFPCYKWDQLRATDFAWWRARLQRASTFYHAFRIDHVLGFFRIWQVPANQRTGMLGRFVPAIPLRESDITACGFDKGDMELLCEASFSRAEIEHRLQGFSVRVEDYFQQEGDWWRFKHEFRSEKVLETITSEKLRGTLFQMLWNRVLVRFDDQPGELYPFWYWHESTTYLRLNEPQKKALAELFARNGAAQEPFWEKNGEELLRMMSLETDMLTCAEDLGVVPNCVAPTLSRLEILSLKIERWTRDWSAEGAPFVHPSQYPRLSVNSPSCHDTSTLRGWWEEGEDSKVYAKALGLAEAPEYLTTDIARAIIQRNLEANSLIAILPLQDWLALHYDLRTPTPAEERINVPGTLDDTNWAWRMHPALECLLDYPALNRQISELVLQRKMRQL